MRLEEAARKHSDEVMSRLNDPGVIRSFDPAYFDTAAVSKELNEMRAQCDFEHAGGGFVDSYHYKVVGGIDTVLYFYEYRLACGHVRYIAEYTLGQDTFHFIHFGVEDAGKPNPLILHRQNNE
jgi:hypothetical protein